MRELSDIRDEISRIDKEMLALFEERMQCSRAVAEYKKENGIPVKDEKRERELIERNSGLINNKKILCYYKEFFNKMLKLSCEYQEKLINGERDL